MTEHKKDLHSECEEWFFLSLSEVASSFGTSSEMIIEIIDEGIVRAEKDDEDQWRFDNEAIGRIRTVLRLHRDLGVNFAGAGLALELLKEIDRLHGLLSTHSKK